MGKTGQGRAVAKPGEKRTVEAKETRIICPGSLQKKLLAHEWLDRLAELDLAVLRPPASALEETEMPHALLVDLHQTATDPIRGDQIVGDQEPVQFDRIPAHWPAAVQPISAIDDRIWLG